MPLQPVHHADQFPMNLGALLLQVGKRERVADPGDDVLALRIDQVVAEWLWLAARRVAGEADTGARVLA